MSAPPAVRGTALIGLACLVSLLARPAPEPVAARIVRLEGEGVVAGWYEADDLAEAAREAGATPPALTSDAVRDGDRVRLVAGWALPDRQAAPVESVALGRRMSVNHATAAELEALPGIGPALAARIVAGRPYRRVADLDRVKGIGPARLRALTPLVEP